MAKRKRDQWRPKRKRKRKSQPMTEEVKQELAQNKAEKNTSDDDKHMERFHKSQDHLRRSSARDRARVRALQESHFRDKYPEDVWAEVMEGLRAEGDGEV